MANNKYEYATIDLGSSHILLFIFSFASSRAQWAPPIIICLGLGILGIIASVIVLSLIPVYLTRRDVNFIQNSGIEEITFVTIPSILISFLFRSSTIDLVFATNFRGGSNFSVVDVDSLTRQVSLLSSFL